MRIHCVNHVITCEHVYDVCECVETRGRMIDSVLSFMCVTLCRRNGLGAEGAKALAPALGLLTSLGTLDLK